MMARAGRELAISHGAQLAAQGLLGETGADSMAGVLAKARALQVKTVRACCKEDVVLGIADDLVRLTGPGSHV